MSADLPTPPETWRAILREGELARETLLAWEVARAPKIDAWLQRVLGFAPPLAAYVGAGRVDVYETDFGACYVPVSGKDEGLPAVLVPALMGDGSVLDLLAIVVPIGAGPAIVRRRGVAEALGFGDASPARSAFDEGRAVRLARDPIAWLRAWAEEGGLQPPCACILEPESWDMRRLLLDAELVCDGEDLAAEIDRFRRRHDRGLRESRGRILVEAEQPQAA